MRTIATSFFLLLITFQLHAQKGIPIIIEESFRETRSEYGRQNGLPLVFLAAEISYDMEGTPVLRLLVQNLTHKTIGPYTIEVYCYDNDNRPVNHEKKGTNLFVGKSQFLTQCLWNTYFPDSWELKGYPKATRLKIYLRQVDFWDGASWIPSDKSLTLVESVPTKLHYAWEY